MSEAAEPVPVLVTVIVFPEDVMTGGVELGVSTGGELDGGAEEEGGWEEDGGADDDDDDEEEDELEELDKLDEDNGVELGTCLNGIQHEFRRKIQWHLRQGRTARDLPGCLRAEWRLRGCSQLLGLCWAWLRKPRLGRYLQQPHHLQTSRRQP